MGREATRMLHDLTRPAHRARRDFADAAYAPNARETE